MKANAGTLSSPFLQIGNKKVAEFCTVLLRRTDFCESIGICLRQIDQEQKENWRIHFFLLSFFWEQKKEEAP